MQEPASPYPEQMTSRWFVGTAVIVASATLFLLTAIVLGTSVVRMLDNTAKTDQAQTILHEVGDLQDAMAHASTAARTYILSHDRALLRDRTQALNTVSARVHSLETLLADDPANRTLIAAIRLNLERRINRYDQLIAGTSKNTLISGEAERLRLARINDQQLTELRERANSNFKHYQTLVTTDMRLSMVLALITGIASPLFGFVGVHLIRRERETQQARELQMELIHVQRQAIMGETSAMLAHEINQPLTAASNYIGVVRRLLDSETPDKSKAILDRVEQQIQRAAAIVRKLRNFIEKRDTERSLETADLLVEDAITLLGTIDGTIDLKTEITPDLPSVMVDRVQIQQVLVNLMRNAIEAMADHHGRALTLAVRPAGPHAVEISLADTGPGLAAEVAARLFQPFVSTKEAGMGIGLSICHRIIANHGGRIWAEANPEGGTIFRFTLPAAENRAAA